MEAVDNAVVTALEKRLFQPERLTQLLGDILEKSADADADRKKTRGCSAD